ncbi:MAG: GAF domain-containing protein [Elusimicrobia bacterium]|nr:GAF domain-containing protein [Candidatus Liberimonas magnetica]
MDKNNNSTKDLKEIFDIAKSISSLLDVDTLLKRIGSVGERLLDSEASSIMLLDDDKEFLSFKVASGEKGGVIQKLKVKVGQGIAGLVAQERKPIIVNDAAHDPRFTGKIDHSSGFITRSILCVPMLIDDQLVGVMEVLNKKESAQFDENDLNILESLASLAAVSINNARSSEDQRNFFVNIIEILITAIESRNPKLLGHCWRVAQLATSLGKQLGLEGQEYKNLYYGALLHDIGILNVKLDISIQQGVITVRDMDPETTHPKLGSEMVKNINLLKGAVPIIRHHHENYDGTGFPDGLAADKIPLGARIVAIAEIIDEMHIGGIDPERINQMIKLGKETKFDPQIIDLLIKEFVENKS